MGHEFAGIVHTVGSKAVHFRSGDRVTANPLVSSGSCRLCLEGKPQLCATRQLIGAHRPGAFAEYVAVPERNVYALEQLTLEEGALTEPFACGVHICRLLQLDPADRLLIIGAGPIGIFALVAAQQFGLRKIVVLDLNKERLSIVEALGGIPASTPEKVELQKPHGGFDVSIDAVGNGVTRQSAVNHLRAGGKVCFSGLHEADSQLPVNTMIRNEIVSVGAFAYAPKDFECALSWLKEGRVDIRKWIEVRPLEEGGPSFEKLLHSPGNTAKILLHI